MSDIESYTPVLGVVFNYTYLLISVGPAPERSNVTNAVILVDLNILECS